MAENRPDNSNSDSSNISETGQDVAELHPDGVMEGANLDQGEGKELSEEEIDKMIAEEDPEFAASLQEIGSELNTQSTELEIFDYRQILKLEEERWSKATGVKKILIKIFPFVPRVSIRIVKIRILIILRYLAVKSALIYFKNNAPSVTKEFVVSTVGKIKNRISKISQFSDKLSGKQKASFFGLIVFTGAAFYGLYYTYKHNLISEEKDPFIASFQEEADDIYDYNPKVDVEPFFDSVRVTQNIVYIPRMVLNLKTSKSSGPNPMAAFEIYVEGISPDVAVELKDREVEIKDGILRIGEEMSYDELESFDGKKAYLEKMRKQINAILTKGQIRRVFFKTIIAKP